MKSSSDPEAEADAARERRTSLIERRSAAEETASGLTSDLRSVYGLGSLPLFGISGTKKKTTPVLPTPTSSESAR